MEPHSFSLVPGHFHQAWDDAFTALAEVRPASMPDHWWVRINGTLAAGKPVMGEEVPVVLESAGFRSKSWRSWPIR
jgi:hypothetical protein